MSQKVTFWITSRDVDKSNKEAKSLIRSVGIKINEFKKIIREKIPIVDHREVMTKKTVREVKHFRGCLIVNIMVDCQGLVTDGQQEIEGHYLMKIKGNKVSVQKLSKLHF